MAAYLQNHVWKKYLLRVSILFILLLSLPLQSDFYKTLFTISWQYFIADVFHLVTFLPHYFGEQNGVLDWILILIIALIGAAVWLKKEKPGNADSEQLYYYYLRIFVRFKLAAILFVAGFLKLFPIFVPELSLSHLNTAYGYFADWKHLLLSLSAAPAYLVFLGIVELIAAVLLLFRKTAFLAVIFVIPFYGNAFLADLAYQGPTYFVSTYIVLLTLPIFVYDLQRLGSLIVDFKETLPANWKLDWREISWSKWRLPLKAAFVFVFIVLTGVRSYSIYQQPDSSLHYPSETGLPDIEGKYMVDIFVLNGDTLASSPIDSVRWKDVVFEKWNTLSVRKVNTVFKDEPATAFFQREDDHRDYEYTQVGDRLYYRYTITNDSIALKNPNRNYHDDTYLFKLERPDSVHINLAGFNVRGDTLQVGLRKVDKKYLLYEVKKIGRRGLGYKL
ncbi:DoxX family protein [Sphingobacterium sp. DN00404]|uniref:DoxX family protein n=1 Tax=Sphingobacterium micropteri TaxID=2763501 RepID=A0ABR7YT74_9SPHI|nr:DoxX family protein [Sphingobacterium micropteri]MBD1434544.1 DoxX family protein [Sphingobacterium micropteri]